jgi:site-specific DNA-methyltransferase (adenine-specific)
VLAKKKFGLTKRNHIVWTFTFGKAAQKSFTNSHCHILYYVKNKNDFFFDENAVRVPSARQLVYNDKRALRGGKQPDDVWMLLKDQMEPYLTPDTDTWLESRICGTFKERCKHSPNQLPVPLVERIVLAASRPGDMVVDPFVGTGTAALAALKRGRRFWGCDLSKVCVTQALRRVASLRTTGKIAPAKN